MKKRMKKLASLLLSVSMTFGMISFPVYATPADGTENETAVVTESPETEEPADAAGDTTEPEAEEQESTQPETTNPDTAQTESQPKVTTVKESFTTYQVKSEDIDVSGVTPYSMSVDEEDAVEVDEDDPIMTTVEEELKGMTVLNEDGEAVPLTEEQIQQVLYVWNQYQTQWEENANLLGVQLPFFLSFNDDKDSLGVLGEMLVLADVPVEKVRNGEYSFDDLMGMIQNFLYADKFGIKFYGSDIASKRDEALKKVDNSGAKTLVQKMLVLNDWLAHETTFDMAYIMQDEDGNPIMVAENPQKNEHYDEIYDEMYALYEDQIEQQFHDQIFAGVEADLRQQFYKNYIWNIVYNQTLGKDESEASEEEKQAASDSADAFMDDNADAISEDADAFVRANFGDDLANQISSEADDFIKDAEENGVSVGKDENGNDVIMTVEQITQQTMANEKIVDLDGDGEPETTANDAIPIYAKAAAEGLTEGIIGAWEGNHIGILAEGTGVCAGYAKAFAYLLQYMSPEKYGVNGAGTDMSKAENWKTSEELYYTDGKLDIDRDYIVDMVRITYEADVTMFGEPSTFGEVHFWNAVKVDGKWYYIDPCYADIYVECMNRDRVEIDGSMNHMYFMFSHTTANEMYDGNMPEGGGIVSLYSDVATDQSYEESWVARIASNTYINNETAYYMYDSTDMISMMREFNSGDQTDMDWDTMMEMQDPDYKLVAHTLTNNDVVDGGADSDFTTLIYFNPKNDDDEVTTAQVYNPSTKEMEDNELITELFAQYKEECGIYPSIKMTAALYDGKLYFNLSNCILSYKISDGTVEKVKEYNKISATRDDTIALGGRAFNVVSSEEGADFTFYNRPIAALTIKDDGKMYVSIATNLGFISGKDAVNDTEHYGYAYEESNYNEDYSSYSSSNDSGMSMGSLGYDEETNDNDEFMWSAVFVDTINMKSACSHSKYETVTVEPTCGREGYTEERCTSCGAPKADSRVVNEGTALDHHYVHFDETYYTKDDNGNRNTGECYVCTVCGFAIEEPDEPEKNAQESDEDFEKRQKEYEKEKAIWDDAVANHGHTYEPADATWSNDSTSVSFTKLECSSVCPDKKSLVDCLLDDNTISVTLKDKATGTAELDGYEGECTTGATAIYKASGEAEGYKWTATNKVALDPGQHAYEGKIEWTEVKDDNGKVTDYTVAETTTLTCGICGDVQKDVPVEVKKETTDPTCGDDGKTVYTATATAKDSAGKTIGSITDSKEIVIPATGKHTYGDWTVTAEATYAKEGSRERTCSVCGHVDTEKIPTVEAESVTISQDKLELEVGEYAELSITCVPAMVEGDEDAILWSSTDEKVATVSDSGKVTARGSGTATIKAAIGGKKATCEVTVRKSGVRYMTHIQSYGWEKEWKENGEMSGTSGESKRLEGIKIELFDTKYSGGIEYSTHVQSYGWQDPVADGKMSGTSGESKRLEAIKINLTGEIAEKYDVYYRVHAQTYGWLDWAKNGEEAGTAGLSKRLEGIEIVLVAKGGDAPGDTDRPYVTKEVGYSTHVQTYGWQGTKYNGEVSGTSGESKRLEAIKISLVDPKYEGSIEYQTHVQTYGWMDYVADGEASGTSGESKRLEAIRIKLTGEMAEKYDVYYRVHAQQFGWMGWAKNGQSAGTSGYSYRLEAIQILLVKKGADAPGNTTNHFVQKTK
ncbi:MAG: Ig-like domain-containing protein [bacterium]|nr:Ig-like domain-containing protein [bacterium]MDY5458124.1 Ig-like domain-containing protein [Bariatricus sp.]